MVLATDHSIEPESFPVVRVAVTRDIKSQHRLLVLRLLDLLRGLDVRQLVWDKAFVKIEFSYRGELSDSDLLAYEAKTMIMFTLVPRFDRQIDR